jgi:hypothetical protein
MQSRSVESPYPAVAFERGKKLSDGKNAKAESIYYNGKALFSKHLFTSCNQTTIRNVCLPDIQIYKKSIKTRIIMGTTL